MIYQKRDGTVINITINEYLSLNDSEFKEEISIVRGNNINNPFSGSTINDKSFEEDEDECMDDNHISFISIEDMDQREILFEDINIDDMEEED